MYIPHFRKLLNTYNGKTVEKICPVRTLQSDGKSEVHTLQQFDDFFKKYSQVRT